MTMPHIHHLTLTVRDAHLSAQWYQDLLGEAGVVERDEPQFRRVRCVWPNGLIIGFTEHVDGASDIFDHRRTGLDHLGLGCSSEDEVREWARRSDELGFHHGPVEEAPYGWAVTLRDPDDIAVEFFAPRTS